MTQKGTWQHCFNFTVLLQEKTRNWVWNEICVRVFFANVFKTKTINRMLKKNLIILLLLGVSAGTAVAQASVSLGLKAGLNFANVNTSSISETYNSRTGYHAGAFVNIKLTKLAIVPEI